jgi:hypothetical protein
VNLVAFFIFEYQKVSIGNFLEVGAFNLLINAMCALGLNVAVVFLVFFSSIDKRLAELPHWY